MKTLIATLILSFVPQLASADSAAVEQLKQTLEYYKTTYPKFIDTSFNRYISQFMFMRYFDYVTAASSLVAQAQAHSLTIQQMENNWDEAASNVDTAFDLEDKSVTFHALLGMSARELETVKQIQADLLLLRKSYQDRCSDQSLKYAYDFFEPKNLFRIDSYSVDPSLSNVQMSMPVNFAGEVQGIYASHAKPEYEAMLRATRYAGNQTIGGYKGQMIAAFIGAALVEFFNNQELKQQEDIQKKINEAMQDAVNDKSVHAQESIKSTCNELLPKDVLSFLDSVVEQENQMPALVKKAELVNQKFASDFNRFPKEILNEFQKINLLLDQQAVKIEKDYEKTQNENLALQLKQDDDLRRFLSAELIPAVTQLNQANTSEAQKTQIKQTLWGLLLRGEAQFDKDNLLWRSIAEVMQKEISK